MSDNSKIEWCDATLNAINGCSVHSAGCTNCYAMKQAHRFPARQGLTRQSKGGMVWTGDVRFAPEQALKALSWKRPRRIFWNAHGDTFHEKVPHEWIDMVMAVCALTPHHTHMILTKRSGRMRHYMSDAETPRKIARVIIDMLTAGTIKYRDNWPVQTIGEVDDPDDITIEWPIANVQLGVSVENQAAARERIPDLLRMPAAYRFLSCEPLLEAVNLTDIDTMIFRRAEKVNALNGDLFDFLGDKVGFITTNIDLVIVGGESGNDARPMHPDWARKIRNACKRHGTTFTFKQWGEWFPWGEIDAKGNTNTVTRGEDPRFWKEWPDGGGVSIKLGKSAAGRYLDGEIHNGGLHEG